MAKILLGKPVAEVIRADIRERVAALETKGVTPTILVLRVGARAEDVSYEKGILKTAGNLGINVVVDEIDESVTTEEMIKKVEAANADSSVHAIMMFRPLPRSIDESAVVEAISPAKDIDCMTSMNLAGVFAGKDVFAPCTAEAVIEMLKFNNFQLAGTKVALLGRSMVVGKPLAMLLLKENATVTICHSRTRNRKDITVGSDIVISAMGQPRLLGPIDFDTTACVIDVGINDDGNGGICGDVDFDLVAERVLAINPAIGGLGTITTSLLLKHAVIACEKANS